MHEADLVPWAEARLQLDTDLFKVQPGFPPWQEIVPQITSPTLLLTGNPRKGARVMPHTAKQIEQALPRCKVVHILWAGHNIRRSQYAPTIEAVKNFLRENLSH